MKFAIVAIAAAAGVVAGCASVTKGTTQNITINSSPSGAACTVEREGKLIEAIAATPQIVKVSKSKSDLTLTCNLEGYREAKHVIPSDVEAMTAGNVIFGGLVGLAIDASTGAMNKYDANVTVVMQKAE